MLRNVEAKFKPSQRLHSSTSQANSRQSNNTPAEYSSAHTIEHGNNVHIDWEIKHLPAKGVGMIANRRLPALYRIIVEDVPDGCSSHPAIAHLLPENGTLQEKFECNLGITPPEFAFVGDKCSQANHSCTPNASIAYCCTTKTLILYACRDIEQGEEICINYKFTNEFHVFTANSDALSVHLDLILAKQKLTTFGVTCPAHCVCDGEIYERNLIQLRELHEDFEVLKQEAISSDEALNVLNLMLALLDTLNASAETKARFHAKAMEVEKKDMITIEKHQMKIRQIAQAIRPPLTESRKF